MTTAQQPTSHNYTVFIEMRDDHSKVRIIASEISGYAAARQIAHRTRGIVMFADQFAARFRPTSPNRMNGILS